MGIRMFELECPIGLQLACIGSKSTINYGAHATIVFGNQSIDKYFDVANIDYYDAILGTLFLRRIKLSLDFNGPGHIHMGTTIIPNGANQLHPEDNHPRVVVRVRTTVPNSNWIEEGDSMKVELPTTTPTTRHGPLTGARLHERLNSNTKVTQRLTAIKTHNGQWTIDDFLQSWKHWEEDLPTYSVESH